MAMKIGKDVEYAAKLLRHDQLVAIPTETVYGLAANALRQSALVKVFETKQRPRFDPLIVHVAHADVLTDYVREVPTWALDLIKNFWPGPLTLLLPKQDIIPDLCTAGLAKVAVRMPRHPLALALLQQLDFPLAAPSANPFGFVSPTTAAHVADQLTDQVDYVLDGGPATVGLESTIVGYEGSRPVVYRLGGVPLEALEQVVGKVHMLLNQSSNPAAPGQLKSHYSPGIPLELGDLQKLRHRHEGENYALLSLQPTAPDHPFQEVLSPTGNLSEAAQNLFGALRRLRKAGVSLILAEEMPDRGLGRAINDRLRRASAG